MNNSVKVVKNLSVQNQICIKKGIPIFSANNDGNNDPVEQPKSWEWEAPPIYSKFLERVSDTISLGAFTTDVAVPLGLIAESAGIATAAVALSLGAGLFRLTKGGLETAAGIANKKIPHVVSGILDIGIGTCTLMAGFGAFPVVSMLAAIGLLGIRTAYGEANGAVLAQAFGKKVAKKVVQGVQFIGHKLTSLFYKQPPIIYNTITPTGQ